MAWKNIELGVNDQKLDRERECPMRLAGVAGGTGSGKTEIVRQVAMILGSQLTIVECDAYYRQREGLAPDERGKINYDHPDALDLPLLFEHLDCLERNRPVETPVYDYALHRRLEQTRTLPPAPIVIVEGILALSIPALRERMDLKVFVDAPDPVRFARRLRRDVNERGRSCVSVIHQYLRSVCPMHDQFVLPSRTLADIVLDGCGDAAEAARLVVARLRDSLDTSGASAR